MKKLKSEFNDRVLMKVFEEGRISSAPLLSDAITFIQHEGKEHSYQSFDGALHETEYKKFGGEFHFTAEEIIAGGVQNILDRMRKLGEDAGSQMEKQLFAVLHETTEETGNVVKANGPMTHEHFIALLDKMDLDFDRTTGKPIMPVLAIHPNMTEAAKKLIKEQEKPENKKAFDELIERKRKEWNDRENRRKLAD